MTHELEVKITFKRKKFCTWWTAKRPRQNQALIVVLDIRNKSSIQFSGADVGDLKFSGYQRLGLTHHVKFASQIGQLAPGEHIVVESMPFITYYSGHCSIDVALKATDGQPIEIWLKGPASLKYEKESRANYFMTACYVDSEELVSQKWSSRLSFLLSLVAAGASLIALKIGQDSMADANSHQTFQKETATKAIQSLDSLKIIRDQLVLISGKLDAILACSPNKVEKQQKKIPVKQNGK